MEENSIGGSIALRLASEGANVVINDLKKNNKELNNLKKLEKNYSKCLVIYGDISKSKVTKELIKKLK